MDHSQPSRGPAGEREEPVFPRKWFGGSPERSPAGLGDGGRPLQNGTGGACLSEVYMVFSYQNRGQMGSRYIYEFSSSEFCKTSQSVSSSQAVGLLFVGLLSDRYCGC